MTTSATSDFDPNRATLIRRSYQIAGLLEAAQDAEGSDASLAADVLGMELTSLVSEGVLGTWITRTTQALVASTASYTLTDCLDVQIDANNICGTIVPSSGAEIPVAAITRAEYVAISNKDTEGTPTICFIERLASVTLSFWPVPADASSFRYSKIRFPRDMSSGSVTLDLSKRWHKAIAYSMAYQLALAKSLPLDRVRFLRDEAERFKAMARESDVEKVHGQLFYGRW